MFTKSTNQSLAFKFNKSMFSVQDVNYQYFSINIIFTVYDTKFTLRNVCLIKLFNVGANTTVTETVKYGHFPENFVNVV